MRGGRGANPTALIAEGAEALDVPLDQAAAEALSELTALLLKWNQRINLVAPCTTEEAIDRHVHDSLAVLRLLDDPEVAARTQAWWDVGTGPGFPGLVLAVARPALRLTLVEPIGKKIAFASQAAAALKLKNVSVRQVRVEELEAGPGPDGAPRGALSRATFAPAEWLRVGSELVGPGGLVLVSLGGAGDPDLTRDAWKVDSFRLPLSGAGRVNALFEAR